MRSNFQFPDDENGDVLRRMQEDGDDLSKPRDVEFFFVFDDETAAHEFAQRTAAIEELTTAVSLVEDREVWQAVCVIYMIPTHVDITRLETDLIRLAEAVDGVSEGWGCMQVD